MVNTVMASNDQGERSQSKVGSKDITSVLEWLPPAESLEANMAAAERLPPQFQQVFCHSMTELFLCCCSPELMF